MLYEIFCHTFEPLNSLPSKTIARLCMALLAIAMATLMVAFWHPASHPRFPWYVDLLSTMNRSAVIVTAGSLWSIVMYARALGIPWHSRVAEIARGFLVYLSVEAVTTTITGYGGQVTTLWCNRVAMSASLVAFAIWLRGIRQKEIPAVLPTPQALKSLRTAVVHLRRQAIALVVSSTRLREE